MKIKEFLTLKRSDWKDFILLGIFFGILWLSFFYYSSFPRVVCAGVPEVNGVCNFSNGWEINPWTITLMVFILVPFIPILIIYLILCIKNYYLNKN